MSSEFEWNIIDLFPDEEEEAAQEPHHYHGFMMDYFVDWQPTPTSAPQRRAARLLKNIQKSQRRLRQRLSGKRDHGFGIAAYKRLSIKQR